MGSRWGQAEAESSQELAELPEVWFPAELGSGRSARLSTGGGPLLGGQFLDTTLKRQSAGLALLSKPKKQ